MSRAARVWLLLTLGALLAAPPASAQTRTVSYTVRQGDTLSELAQLYLVQPDAYQTVARLNRISNPRRLPVGRVLRFPVPLLRTSPAEARVVSTRGPAAAQRVSGGPEALTVGTRLGEGAVISTGANAFVRLALPDGGHVALPSQSRVRIARLRTILLTGATDQMFRLESGRIESEVTPVREPGGFSIATPIAVSAVRGTSFRSAYEPDLSRGGTEVIEGSVAVAGASAELIAAAGQGVAVRPDGLALADLLPAPELLDPDAVQTSEAVALRIAPAPGAVRHRVRLATDAGMVDAFAESEGDAAGGLVTVPDIPDGLFFARVSAVSADGLEGQARVYTLVRLRSGLANLAATPSGSGRDRQYLFRWGPEGEGPAEFRFQLNIEGEEAPVLDEAGLAQPRLTLTGLRPGEYSWRVRITRRQFGRVIETWSDPQALRIGR